MAEKPSGERTHAPTPKRLRDAAQRGDLLQSRELATALGVFAGALWLLFFAEDVFASLALLLAEGLTLHAGDVEQFDPVQRLLVLVRPLLTPLLWLTALMVGAGVLTPAVLGSLGWRGSALTPRPSRMNPLAGIKRMAGPQGWAELGRALLKVVFLGSIAIACLWTSRGDIAALGSAADPPIGAIAALFVELWLWVMGGMILIALIDAPIQWQRRMARLKMSLQEVRDEHKEQEGSPEKRAAIRRRQQAILSRSMRAGIRQAQAVITNPQHFAVAIRYRPETDAAPVIVARGSDELAAAIRSFAGECGVPIVSLPPFARALYFTGQVGEVIDTRLFAAAAMLLAHIFRLDSAAAKGGALMLPDIPMPEALRFDADGRRAP